MKTTIDDLKNFIKTVEGPNGSTTCKEVETRLKEAWGLFDQAPNDEERVEVLEILHELEAMDAPCYMPKSADEEEILGI